jgi:hypothetical protein
MTDLKKPGVAFWATVAIVCLPLLYVLSYGILGWLFWRGMIPAYGEPVLAWVYAPFRWAMEHGPAPVAKAIFRYVEFWRG